MGPPAVRAPRGSFFASLVAAITYQQLAGAAAQTIHGRVVEALQGRVTPESVLRADPKALRGAGLSRGKLRAILDLAGKCDEGTVRLRSIRRLADADVVEHLTQVWGIGAWTAEMFLMFDLHRPDVWPVGDLGVRSGWARIHGMEVPPTAEELTDAAEHLRPWRSAAAWYCWRAVEVLAPGG
ncbi:MAG TPA: hypothetical protein VK858_20565 [Longimicrobiales bacterium]|nr:hypothetical protein [Longimicrobiales bacterium]